MLTYDNKSFLHDVNHLVSLKIKVILKIPPQNDHNERPLGVFGGGPNTLPAVLVAPNGSP